MGGKNPLSRLLEEGLREVYPAAQACVLVRGEAVFREAKGEVALGGGRRVRVDLDSVFDLASLTKPLATTLVAMSEVARDRLPLDQPAHELLGRPLAAGSRVTVRRLLSHASGLPAWRPFPLEVPPGPGRRAEILRRACQTRAIVPPGTEAIYSDLNFLILTALLEKRGGERLDRLFARVAPDSRLFFRPLPESRPDRRVSRFVPTERDGSRGLLAGLVNDENAYAMDGVAGHAGLFGDAHSVARHVQGLLDAWKGRAGLLPRDTVRLMWTPTGEPPGSTWALGWDTPSASGSSAGAKPPAGAVGHTGFTGTSVWVEPEREVVAVLLTNRVWPDRANLAIRAFRPRFHGAVWEAFL